MDQRPICAIEPPRAMTAPKGITECTTLTLGGTNMGAGITNSKQRLDQRCDAKQMAHSAATL
eukprot:2797034-Karenia_brevis.AAC.1